MTGTLELAAKSVRVEWANVRIITASSMRDMTMAESLIGSPRPSWVSRGDRKIAWPPSWIMPASNDSRVRVEAFSKIIPSTRFFRGSNRTPRSRRSFSSMPRRTRLFSSWGVQSISERKCLALISTTFIAAARSSAFRQKKGTDDWGSHGERRNGKGAILSRKRA